MWVPGSPRPHGRTGQALGHRREQDLRSFVGTQECVCGTQGRTLKFKLNLEREQELRWG